MAERAVHTPDTPTRERRSLRWLVRRWWVSTLLVYAASRVASTGIFVLAASVQGESRERWWAGAHPPLSVFVGRFWDGWWYREIAAEGYPATLPVADGVVQMNQWAFFPLFPMLARGVMRATGLPWEIAAPTLAVVLGAAAMLVVHRALELGAPRAVAAWPGLPLASVAVLSVYPAAAVLQVAYTESLALLLVATVLLLVVRRSYLWACLPVVALGFTRAVAAPLLVVLVVHAAVQARDARGTGLPATRSPSWWRVGVLAAVIAASAVVWPAVCALVTGVPDAYLQTQATWRGDVDVGLFAGAQRLASHGLLGVAVGVLVLGAAAALALTRSSRRLGPELYAWTGAYILYLAAVADLISSVVRFGLLAFPLAAALLGLRSRTPASRAAWLAIVIVVALIGQVGWVFFVWVATPGDTTFWSSP